MSDQELEILTNEPFGSGVPAKFHQIRDALNHKFAPVGTDERKAVLELANIAFAARTELDPNKRSALHVEMLTAVDAVRKMQARRARGEEE